MVVAWFKTYDQLQQYCKEIYSRRNREVKDTVTKSYSEIWETKCEENISGSNGIASVAEDKISEYDESTIDNY